MNKICFECASQDMRCIKTGFEFGHAEGTFTSDLFRCPICGHIQIHGSPREPIDLGIKPSHALVGGGFEWDPCADGYRAILDPDILITARFAAFLKEWYPGLRMKRLEDIK